MSILRMPHISAADWREGWLGRRECVICPEYKKREAKIKMPQTGFLYTPPTLTNITGWWGALPPGPHRLHYLPSGAPRPAWREG
jgi:hypothetical protein